MKKGKGAETSLKLNLTDPCLRVLCQYHCWGMLGWPAGVNCLCICASTMPRAQSSATKGSIPIPSMLPLTFPLRYPFLFLLSSSLSLFFTFSSPVPKALSFPRPLYTLLFPHLYPSSSQFPHLFLPSNFSSYIFLKYIAILYIIYNTTLDPRRDNEYGAYLAEYPAFLPGYPAYRIRPSRPDIRLTISGLRTEPDIKQARYPAHPWPYPIPSSILICKSVIYRIYDS